MRTKIKRKAFVTTIVVINNLIQFVSKKTSIFYNMNLKYLYNIFL